jgi:hypothetical protein
MAVIAPVVNQQVNANLLDGYDNSIWRLAIKVKELIFSKWGMGLAVLSTVTGACFGLPYGIGIAISSFCCLVIASYFLWRAEGEPRDWHLRDAVVNGNTNRVRTILSHWQSFNLKEAMSEFFLVSNFQDAINANRREIARLILAKLKGLHPNNRRIKSMFIEAANLNNRAMIDTYYEVYGSIPTNWLIGALEEASKKGHEELVDLFLTSRNLNEISINSVEVAMVRASTERISKKIINAFIPFWNDFWDQNSSKKDIYEIMFSRVCQRGYAEIVRRLFLMIGSHDRLPEIVSDEFLLVAEMGNVEIMRVFLQTNRFANRQSLENAILLASSNEIRTLLREYARSNGIRING